MLAAEAFFLAGMLMQAPKARGSAAWWWSLSMFLLGCAALLGGVDHGFVEPAGLPRAWIQRLTWLLLGGTTLCVVQTLAAQFLAGGTAVLVSRAGWAQLLVYAVAMLAVDSFLVAVLNYAPVMLWFLAMNLLRLRDGRGSWPMITGTGLLFAASAVQALGIGLIGPVDHNGLYHLISMPALWLLFLGGRRLDATRPRAS